MIRFACPRCKAVLEVPDPQAGGKVACPKCQQHLRIPTSTPANRLVKEPIPLPDALFCPSCGLIFDEPPKKDGTCVVCDSRFVMRQGRILSLEQAREYDAKCETKARSLFPVTDTCSRCGEMQWKFVSLSPNERSAVWICDYCGKKVFIRRTIIRPSVGNRRIAIPKPVQREVWRRDQGRCTQCGSNEKLEFDHIVPVTKGGSNTARNVQLLCESCNRRKQARIG